MAKRVCYIHVGPHKTGTSSIQWFLKENRAELGRDFCRRYRPRVYAQRLRDSKPDESTERRLRRAVREMTAIAEQVMADLALAVEAPWNDLQQRF